MNLWRSLKRMFSLDPFIDEEGQPIASMAPAPFVLKSAPATPLSTHFPSPTQSFYKVTVDVLLNQIRQNEALAIQEDPEAQKTLSTLYYTLGMKHYLGAGVPKKPVEAFTWFMRAAELGHLPSLFRLAILYKVHPQGENYLLRVRYWLTKIVTQNNENALLFLGHLYEFGGRELYPDRQVAQDWYCQYNQICMPQCTFAKKAYLNAKQYEQPEDIIHANGMPSVYSPMQAVNWYVYAAELGSSKAMLRLGTAYEEGDLGLEKDPAKAKSWLDHYHRTLPTYQNDPTHQLLGELGTKRIAQMNNPFPRVNSDGLHG